MNIEISAHGRQRARKRLGLTCKAVRRAVETAWRDGIPERPRHSEIDPTILVKRWREALFLFSVVGQIPNLVTVTGAKQIDEQRVGVLANEEFRHWRRERRQKKSRRCSWRKRRKAAVSPNSGVNA